MNKPKILIPIHPEWCEKIFNGEKTIEVRKTAPKIDTPFEVCVYQTKHKGGKAIVNEVLDSVYGGGKVIGSFVCDWIKEITPHCDIDGRVNQYIHHYPAILGDDCLSFEQMKAYLGNKKGYDWHITEPKLFDRPRELSEFAIYGRCAEECDEYDICMKYDSAESRVECPYFKKTPLKRAPQSWCYVEEV